MTRLGDALTTLGLNTNLSSQLDDFIELFYKWNRTINLSGARTREEILDHVIDSLYVIPHLATAKLVLDVGSGGGFPVVITAVCLPDTNFVALEPVHKKHAFLRTAARELGLFNLDARAERLDDHDARDYDIAMSRATFDIDDWLALGLPCVRRDGAVIGFEALAHATVTGIQRHPYSLADKTRAIVIRRKPS